MRRVALMGAALAAFLSLASVSDSALAAPRRGVVVRVVPGGPVEAGPATSAVTQALRGAGGEVVDDPLAVARARQSAGAVERSRLADFERARELAREGWRAYLKVDPGFAEAQLVNARRTLEAVLDLDGALELLADVSLRLGAVRLKSGRAAEAQAAFALAATLDPGRDLLAQEFSPAVVAAYQQSASGSGAAAQAALELVVAADATVELDGASVGRGARSLRVAAGEHVVVVRAPGRRPVGQVVLVPASGARVELPVDDDLLARALAAPAPLALGDHESTAARLVDALGLFADLDELWLVVVSWRGGQPTLLGQRCSVVAAVTCTPVREVRFASIARLDAAARQLVRDLAAPGEAGLLGPIVLEDTRATEPEPPSRPGGKKSGETRHAWWTSPWLWAGVGAVALAAGGVWLVSDTGPGPVEWTLPPLTP